MRAGLSTIQQTLTPEAANILNQSIAEADRRNHGQTTPLHVAATLLSSPSGYLRQACIRSHPNSSHPLQCRALELCFSVALERLPTAQTTAAPPLSNALTAALKRAQAHQRRGCPEQQQQPLLAVKVELDQLIISILDDPSVSRVMREASFSSPAVKATIEQLTNNPTSRGGNQHHHLGIGSVNLGGITPRMVANPVLPLGNRNVYLNPRLQQGGMERLGNHRGGELGKVVEIMMRSKKKNPVLVGDSEPEPVAKELLRKIENRELESDGSFKNAQVICLDKGFVSDKSQIPSKIKELGGMIDSRIVSGGVVVYLGDLKWLVEQQQQQHVVSDMGRAAVAEMTKLLARFRGSDDSEGNYTNKLWLVGTATCETYLRCQVYHSNMESDWDLQALPMASRSPLPGMFPRFGTERLLSNPLEKLNPGNVVVPSPLHLSENIDPAQRSTTFCPQCSENYEKELAKLTAIEKSFSEAKQDTTQPSLPQWLRSVKLNTTNSEISDQSKVKTQELQKKWRDTCLHLHPNFHSRGGRQFSPMLSVMNVSDPFARPVPVQPKLQTIKPPLQLNTNQITISPPGSPVRTDLVLGRKMRQNTPERGAEDQAKDFLGCISSQRQMTLLDKFANSLDADNYKSLLKGLMEKAWWQGEAASKVASAITRCRLGGRERRGGGLRGDIWLLFAGPDRAGKRKVASVLSEKICGANHKMICLGTKSGDQECSWGKTVIDRIAEAVRRNPFSVIMLEDIDEADMLVHGSMKRAMERGCLVNSHGREVSLGNAIFILAGDWSSSNSESSGEGHFDHFVDEEKVASVASGNWQLGLVVREKGTKRRPTWLDGEKDRSLKPRKENGSNLALDLNLGLAYIDEDDDDDDTRSYNSSDLTVDHEDELGVANPCFSITSVPQDLLDNVDESIVFKPVDSTFVRREIKKTISLKFSTTVGDNLSLEVEDDVLEKILGGLWHDKTSLGEWVEKVIGPGFDRVKPQLHDRGNSVVRLVVESDSGRSNGNGDWLPSSIIV